MLFGETGVIVVSVILLIFGSILFFDINLAELFSKIINKLKSNSQKENIQGQQKSQKIQNNPKRQYRKTNQKGQSNPESQRQNLQCQNQ